MTNLIETLRSAGCQPRQSGHYITCKAVYRGGNDPTSVAIYPRTKTVVDYVVGQSYSLEQFLEMVLRGDKKQIQDLLEGTDNFGYIDHFDPDDPFTKAVRYFSDDSANSLVKDNSYWNSRGIDDETLDTFGGGLCTTGKMYNRYVFPIFDSRRKIVGLSGRDVTNKSSIKWKHLGQKLDWAYPLIFSHSYITQQKQIILVESHGDMLSLWRSGIRNLGVTFGTSLGNGLLKGILRLDPEQIIVATNNDPQKTRPNGFTYHPGQDGGMKIRNKLLEFFDPKQIVVKFPIKNDFGEQTDEENREWLRGVK